VRDFHRNLLSSEVREFDQEVARLFEDLDRTRVSGRPPRGHCNPALDVVLTDAAVEVILDLPGVVAERLRIVLKQGVLLVVGEKPSPYPDERIDGTFHVVERGFGFFARAVRLDGAFDGCRARATLRGGELRVTVPRIVERRGQDIIVPVASE